MLLRRITEHVKTQNWTAVGLDFFIVVIGVFIGIQVANWNEDRSMNSKSDRFTERLKDDLRDEAWNYQYLIEYYDDVQTSGHRALNALTGKTPLSDEALLVNAYRATQYLVTNRSRSVFDELTSTGALELIRDDGLRELSQWVYNEVVLVDISLGLENVRYRELFRMLVPFEVHAALLENCGDRVVSIRDYKGIVDSLDYTCETGLPPALLAEAANALRADPSMIPYLRLRVANVNSYNSTMTSFNQELRYSLQALAGEAP